VQNKTGNPSPSGNKRPGTGSSDGNAGPSDPLARFAPDGAPIKDKAKRPIQLRPALIEGDRDWVIYVECQKEAVILYPMRKSFTVDSLSHSPAHNPFFQAIDRMIARRQATVLPGDMPYRPNVRFLVQPNPNALRTYYLAYPALETLKATKSRQNLQPEDDPAAIAVGP
jgi:hypothetical protein